MKRKIKALFLMALLLSLGFGSAFAADVSVSTLQELKTAINGSADRIIVSQKITIPTGTTLDGKGKVITVSVPYIGEDGMAMGSGYSKYGLFEIQGTVSLKNMTLYGGYSEYDAGGLYIKDSNVTMENVTISRCYGGMYISNLSTVIMKNCNIVRNVRNYGGGIVCTASKLLMDGCSLSENRSLSDNGGGGAMELNGSSSAYINNTVIANNSSTEIGGAINLYRSDIYMLNSTVSGNYSITSYIDHPGGGIGNNGGFLCAANCIFMDNYHLNGEGNAVRSDVGLFNGNGVTALHNCIYGSIEGIDIEGYADNCWLDNCTQNTGVIFTAYRNDGIFYKTNDVTPEYKHSVVLSKPDNKNALYAPVKNANGGVPTYFEYNADLSAVKMAYGASKTPLGELPRANIQVTSFYEGTARNTSVVGASDVNTNNYYTVKILPGYKKAKITGATVFGDTYPEGTQITVEVTMTDDKYEFKHWADEGANVVSTATQYTFTLTKDVSLLPVTVNPYIVYENSFDNLVERNDVTVIGDHENEWCGWGYGNGYYVYQYDGSKAADDYIVFRALNLKAGEKYVISLDTKSDGFTEKFEVVVGTSNTPAGLTTKVIDPQNIEHKEFIKYTGEFTPEADGEYYFAIHAISDADQLCLYADNFLVERTTLPEPEPETLPTVTLNNCGFATFSCHVDVNVATPNIKVYKLAVDGENISLTPVTGYIPAGNGILLYGGKERKGEIVEFVKATSGTPANMSGNELHATTLADGSLATFDPTSYALGPDDEFLHYIPGVTSFIHNRAYLYPDQLSGAKKISIVYDDDVVTSIGSHETTAAPRNGKVMENNRIVIIKNGVRYNTAGQVIK